MKRGTLPLNALRAFEATMRHGQMKLAAEELGVTDGAISRPVRVLELRFCGCSAETSGRLICPVSAHSRCAGSSRA